LDKLSLSEDSPLMKFVKETKTLSPDERAKHLENTDIFATAHETSANKGQTKPPSTSEDINLHFIAFVEKDGDIYELDGRKEFPINHGPTSPSTFLQVVLFLR
jgi:ubiquitin carboxyl-terminal hydrolase L3